MTNQAEAAASVVAPQRDYDVIVFGANGLTGSLVVRQLAANDTSLRSSEGRRRWAACGRNHEKVAETLADLQVEGVDVLVADLDDLESLRALARQARVVLNLAGPFTPKANNLIEACIEARASYVDLSGEIPLLRRVIDRFDTPAKAAGVQVVQMAGWEAMPADLTTLIACRRAAGDGWGPDGPGAADPIETVNVSIDFTRKPEGGVPFKQQVSAGTLASIVAMLEDRDAALVGHRDALLPGGPGDPASDRLGFGARNEKGEVLAPVPPVALLNPPIVGRTAALLAAERDSAYRPATYGEGEHMDDDTLGGALGRRVRAGVKGGVQRLAVAATALPLTVREAAASGLRRVLPEAGTGPSDRYLEDWTWTVEARATAKNGAVGTATIEGRGHPGYTATAAIIVEVALQLIDQDGADRRSGCLTPALAIGASINELRVESLTLR